MDREYAEKITTEYLKAIYGFALRRCKNLQDAEDLSQDIAIKVFNALLCHDNIGDENRYIWAIAHNSLKNYYRKNDSSFIGVSIEEIEKKAVDDRDLLSDIIKKDSISRVQKEIAYLSKLQRRIVVAYYFENKKQQDIAEELGVPTGTVKWHLFEAKKELRKGMNVMRNSNELKFNPIKFTVCGTNGTIGENGTNESFFRSPLLQNIVYSVWKEPKTVNQIADELGVSPVFIESEVEHLEKYGFLIKKDNRYLCNILIDEPNDEINRLRDEMYERVSEIFANELYDELVKSDILNSDDILGGFAGEVKLDGRGTRDLNFILWAIIPYITSLSGTEQFDNSVSFEQAATYRADGGHNICYATVLDPSESKPKYYDEIFSFYGPCLSENEKLSLWQIDTRW